MTNTTYTQLSICMDRAANSCLLSICMSSDENENVPCDGRPAVEMTLWLFFCFTVDFVYHVVYVAF